MHPCAFSEKGWKFDGINLEEKFLLYHLSTLHYVEISQLLEFRVKDRMAMT